MHSATHRAVAHLYWSRPCGSPHGRVDLLSIPTMKHPSTSHPPSDRGVFNTARLLRHPATGRLLSLAVVCAGYYATGVLSLIARFPSSGISTIWLATPVLLAALLVVPRQTWWMYLLALLPTHLHLVSTFQGPVPFHVMVIQFDGNCAHALLAAVVLHPMLGAPPRLAGLRSMSAFILVASVGVPALVSAAVAVLFWLVGWTQDIWLPWRARSLASGAGALIATPFLLWMATGGVDALRHAPWPRYAEFAVLSAALVAIDSVVLGGEPSGPALLYAPLPLLLWAALRFGVSGLCVSMAVVAIQSLSNAMSGRGPFVSESPVASVLQLQAFLLALGTPLLLLAAITQEQRETLDAVRRGEAALQSGYERIRDLARRLITAQEVERKRIARDLHDDLGQKLALLSIEIGRLERDAPRGHDLTGHARRLSEQIGEAAAGVHRLSHQLHPSRLGRLGLAAAVAAVCRDVSAQDRLKIEFEHRDVPEGIPPDVALCLYRIVQEGLHNVVKHSRARDVHVRLLGDGPVLDLWIIDSGVGFVVDGAENAGMGLVSMRERVSLVGGAIVIHSAPGSGTCIVARVPDDGKPIVAAAPAVATPSG